MRTIYRKTKRGSIIKLIDYSDSSKSRIETTFDKFLYPKHLTPEEICQRLQAGTVYEGAFQTSRDNLLEGYVSVAFNGEDVHVLIQGFESINRAIHDDQVVVEILPQSEWKSKSNFIVLPEQSAEDAENDDDSNVANDNKKLKVTIPTGKVVGIIKRSWRQYPGVLRRKRNASSNIIRCLFIPSDRRIPVIRIETRQYGTLKNQRLVVGIDSWPRSSKFPLGHYIKTLGTIGDETAENQVLLLEHDIPHSEFTSDVLSCLPPNDWAIPKQEFSKRLDLRQENICSVDPPGCTDIDDALHYKDLNNDTCEVGVHIADVSFFVRPDTALDCEASNRCTSVYLADTRIDMIPGHLSSNLCSLIEKQDRLAFSAIWKIKKSTAEIIDTKFTRSVINSKASLTYQRAQDMIDDNKSNSPIHKSLRGLLSLAKKLKSKRVEKGALCLARADEIRFVEVESEAHVLDANMEIQHKKMLDTNSMVEEFMLLANISVARHLIQHFPEIALLRRHPKPSRTNFDDLVNSAKVKGFNIETDDGKSLSGSLDKAKLKNDEYFNLMLRMIATRCMTPASYFCSGSIDTQTLSYSHFGLAADLYTHFTSPIRRYADLLVHRLLAQSIGYSSDIDARMSNKENLRAVCERINYRHRMAQYASRASNKLHTILYIRSKRELVEDSYIFFVKQNAIQVLIPRIAFEYTYFLQPLSEWTFDVTERTQTNSKSKTVLRQFDKIKVHISLSTAEDVRFSEKLQLRIIKPALDKVPSKNDLEPEPIVVNSFLETARALAAVVDSDSEDTPMDVDKQTSSKGNQIAQMKKKVRLSVGVPNPSDLPHVVLAGDDLTEFVKADVHLLGPGLVRSEHQVFSTKCGILKSRSNNLFWIDNHQKRYVAVRNDYVIGIVKSKGSLHSRVDINTSDLASLSLLAFENATKRNKPILNVGDLVYAKILSASKHIETELVCVASNGKRDGLGVIGNKGGQLITVSLDTIRVLLNRNCDFLKRLGQLHKYEVALGMNGRIWINATDPDTIVRVANELHKFDLH